MLSINKSKNARPLTLSVTYGYMVLYYLHWCRNTQNRYLCGSFLLLLLVTIGNGVLTVSTVQKRGYGGIEPR